MAAKSPETSEVHGDRAQVRRRRSTVTRRSCRPVVRRPSRALAVTIARCCLLRHSWPRPGTPPDHVAASHRRDGCGLAPQAARRSRHAHRGRGRRSDSDERRASEPSRRGAGDRAGPPPGAVARISTSQDRRDALRPRRLAARRVLRRPGHRERRRRGRAALAGMGTGTAEGGDRRTLLDRLTNRLLRRRSSAGRARFEAGPGAVDPAGPAADVAQRSPPIRVHRAVAEHVGELMEWDRAVRSDVYDSVHQMRVTTRKIRSLLQSSGGCSASPTMSGSSMSCGARRRARRGRDAEVLAERTSGTRRTPASNVRDRCGNGWSTAPRSAIERLERSLTAMRSTTLFPAARRAGRRWWPPNPPPPRRARNRPS